MGNARVSLVAARNASRSVLDLVVAAGLLLALAVPVTAQVTIDNDLPTATVGHWAVDVLQAGESTSGRITAERFTSGDVVQADEVIYEYLSIVDPGNDGGGIDLAGTVTGVAALSGDDEVTSSGTFTGANGNDINWTAVSEIADGSSVMQTTFTFTAATGTLGVLRFDQYLDEDVAGNADDVLFSIGSVLAGDLELFTVDNLEVYGISHGGAYTGGQGLGGASFAGWAADQYSDLRTVLFGAGAPVSFAGTIDTVDLVPHIHPVVGSAYGPEDITSTLAWNLDPAATTATIITTLGGVPTAPGPDAIAPEVPTLSGVGIVVFALALVTIALARLAPRRRRSG